MTRNTTWNKQKIVTTKEQAELLIAIGMPLDSADHYYNVNPLKYGVPRDTETPLVIPTTTHLGWSNSDYIPCWSPTRLVEIIKTCHKGTALEVNRLLSLIEWDNIIDWLVDAIIMYSKANMFDFSKLNCY